MKTFIKFLEDKGITQEQFAEKGADEQKTLQGEYSKSVEDFTSALTNRIEELEKGDADANKHQIDANKAELEALQAVAEKQGNKINELMDSIRDTAEFKTFSQTIRKGLEDARDTLKAFKEHASKNTSLRIEYTDKASASMTTGNVGPTTYSLSRTVEPGLTDILGINPMFETYCNTGNTNSSRIVFAEKKNRDGSTVFIAEAATKTLIDFDIVEAESIARKVASRIRVSEEMLEDVDFIQSEIENELLYEVNLAVSTGILAGDGVAPNLKGITVYAPAYSLTTIETTTPNTLDCFNAMATQIITNNGMPTHIAVNPVDYTNMNISKGTTGYYVIVNNMAQMLPYQIIQSNEITAGNILVADLRKSIVRNLKGFVAELGYDGTDWSENMVTIRGERRVHHYIRDNHTPCFCYDAIADVKTAITA